ncbi:hypothetical protein Ddc_09944 [Ditylenchus destructor]|nr:hypothetical protein Ddc_09944 [Ditylenchus destructor]
MVSIFRSSLIPALIALFICKYEAAVTRLQEADAKTQAEVDAQIHRDMLADFYKGPAIYKTRAREDKTALIEVMEYIKEIAKKGDERLLRSVLDNWRSEMKKLIEKLFEDHVHFPTAVPWTVSTEKKQKQILDAYNLVFPTEMPVNIHALHSLAQIIEETWKN